MCGFELLESHHGVGANREQGSFIVRSSMFPKARVLIAEDEPLTALDIAATVRETGGEVLGPAASLDEALDLLGNSRIDGAILDCNLRDGEITQIAEALLDTRSEMPPKLQGHSKVPPLFHKPIDSLVLARRLAQCILEEQNRRSAVMFPSPRSGDPW
jgi:CheY-like chemotaxis protein